MVETADADLRSLDYATVLRERARTDGGRAYLRFEDRRFTFRDAHLLSNRVANGLAAHGVRRGEHVALLLDNCPEIAWYYYGIGKLGAVSVPLNTAAKGELLARYLRQADVVTVVAQASLVERLAAILGDCPKVMRWIVVGEEGSPVSRPAGIAVTPHGQVMQAADEDPDVPVRFNDVAYLSFTSGTSGPSKANIVTHSHSFTMAAALAKAFRYGRDEVMYTCLPLFHGNAMRSLFVPMMSGCSVAVARRFSASNFWNDVRRSRATQFNLLGAMANILWAQPASPTDREHRARKCMILPIPSFAAAFSGRFGVELCSTYALTDFGYIAFMSTLDPPSKWASAGRPQPDVELAILDEDDFPVAPGETGEICARNRRPWTSAQGYYGMPEATVSAWRNLWFHTGDRGHVDTDGYLFFVDRKKDAIRRRGENISSFEIEQIVMRHPAVLDVAAYAVASEMSEDEVMVSVVLRPGQQLTERELIGHCADQMAHFMVPRYVQFLDALPRTMTEKVEKYKLRAAAEADLGCVWDRTQHDIRIER